MDISLLNEKIEIEVNEVTIDEIGNHTNSWKEYYSCFATISGESGNEKQEAGQTLEDTSICFTVRYCDLISKINTTNFRVLFRDEVYNIISIDHLNFKKKAIKLKCKKEIYGR